MRARLHVNICVESAERDRERGGRVFLLENQGVGVGGRKGEGLCVRLCAETRSRSLKTPNRPDA